MAILNILRYPNPILKKKAKAIKKIDSKIKKLIADMEETMRAEPGVGLAAPQVGESIRLFVADIGEGIIVMINPKIVKRKGEQTFMEGCLCLPGLDAPVKRASYVKVKGMNLKGKIREVEAQGLLAQVFQHEIDHLDGKVFIDRVEDPTQIRTVVAGTKEENI